MRRLCGDWAAWLEWCELLQSSVWKCIASCAALEKQYYNTTARVSETSEQIDPGIPSRNYGAVFVIWCTREWSTFVAQFSRQRQLLLLYALADRNEYITAEGFYHPFETGASEKISLRPWSSLHDLISIWYFVASCLSRTHWQVILDVLQRSSGSLHVVHSQQATQHRIVVRDTDHLSAIHLCHLHDHQGLELEWGYDESGCSDMG